MSCSSPRHCLAAGTTCCDSGNRLRVDEWNGRVWLSRRIATNPTGPDIDPRSLSCASDRSCVVVGVHGDLGEAPVLPFVERWDGTRWKLTIPPRRGDGDGWILDGVACPRPQTCEVVGTFPRQADSVFEPLAERGP